MDIKLIVATHKKYWMPSDPMYMPVQVGAEGKTGLGYQGDNTGDHISGKNAHYCELTGLYWAWKNVSADYLGLVHYRRHFVSKRGFSDKKSRILTFEKAEKLLHQTDVLLPKKRHYWIETNYNQYVHAHHAIDLDMTRAILKEKFGAYVDAFDATMKESSGHRFNMFIMKKDILDRYCEWLFAVLFELEKRLDISTYSAYDARVFGFVGERLLDVWLRTNKIRSMDIPYAFMEKQNWVTKGLLFLKRKIISH